MMNNFDTEYQKYEKDLSQWESSLSLSFKEQDRNQIQEILDISIDEIKKKSTMELCEYVFMISQYLIFLQKKSNQCDGFLKWSKNIFVKMFGEDRSKLGKLTQKVELRQSRIIYLSRRIEFYAQSINGIVRQRNYGEKNG